MSQFCEYFRQDFCRSCGWIEKDYPAQLAEKEAIARRALAEWKLPVFERTVGSPPWRNELTQLTLNGFQAGFRDRAKMAVTGSMESPVVGLVGETHLDQGRTLLNCPIHHPKLNELIEALPLFIREAKLEPYQIRERRGELKGFIAFRSPGSQQMYLRFVVRSRECVSRLKKYLPELIRVFPHLVSVSCNVQPIPHAILEGSQEIYLTETKTIRHTIGNLSLQISPQGFVQTNTQVAAQLYAQAAAWISEVRPPKMLELFSGQGAFSLFAAQSAAEILGVELNNQAVDLANQNARELGFTRVSFICEDATKVSSRIQTFRPDLVLVNPPRRGLGEASHWIEQAMPKDFLYSSCSIDSLRNDLRKFAKNYQLKRVQIFDMFPHTEHFETLVWLARI